MRIVSQDGSQDIPYEKAVLTEADGVIFAYSDGMSLGCRIAAYSSSEKARKVMADIREEYAKFFRSQGREYFYAFKQPKIFQLPKDEEVKEDD